jgi:hypothetical protein
MLLGYMSGPVPEEDYAVLDEVAAVTASPAVTPADIARLAARDGLRVPPTVTRFDPNGDGPSEVTLRT